jgi:hypothetical protein
MRALLARAGGPTLVSRVLLAAYLGLLLAGIGQERLGRVDEFRTAERSREILATGDWTTVHLNFEPDFRKPPLQYWATAATLKLTDQREWPPRLWSVLGAIAALLATGRLARAVDGRDPWVPALAMLFCLSNARLLVSASSALLDPWMLAFDTAALSAAIASRRNENAWWACAGFVGLGAWQKAPSALGLVAGLCVLQALLGRRDLLRSRTFRLAMALGVALAAAWPLGQWALHGPTFLETYFVDEMVTRTGLLGEQASRGDVTYYARALWETWGLLGVAAGALLLLLPLTPELRRNRDLVAVGALAGALFAALSAMEFRSARYTIFVVPMLSVCIAHALAALVGRRWAVAVVLLCAPSWVRLPEAYEHRYGRRNAKVIEASLELGRRRTEGERVLAVGHARSRLRPPIVLYYGRLPVSVHTVREGGPSEPLRALPPATAGWRGLADERCWPLVQRWFPGAARESVHGRVVHWSARALDAGSVGGGVVDCGSDVDADRSDAPATDAAAARAGVGAAEVSPGPTPRGHDASGGAASSAGSESADDEFSSSGSGSGSLSRSRRRISSPAATSATSGSFASSGAAGSPKGSSTCMPCTRRGRNTRSAASERSTTSSSPASTTTSTCASMRIVSRRSSTFFRTRSSFFSEAGASSRRVAWSQVAVRFIR